MAEKENEELDFTPVEGGKPVPLGWRVLFWGLIVFGVYYLWAYSPAFSGWTQVSDLEGGVGSGGVNIFATIVFTALAAVAAGAILFALSRKKG